MPCLSFTSHFCCILCGIRLRRLENKSIEVGDLGRSEKGQRLSGTVVMKLTFCSGAFKLILLFIAALHSIRRNKVGGAGNENIIDINYEDDNNKYTKKFKRMK